MKCVTIAAAAVAQTHKLHKQRGARNVQDYGYKGQIHNCAGPHVASGKRARRCSKDRLRQLHLLRLATSKLPNVYGKISRQS